MGVQLRPRARQGICKQRNKLPGKAVGGCSCYFEQAGGRAGRAGRQAGGADQCMTG